MYLPLVCVPGDLAQVDFFEVAVGVVQRRTVLMLVMWLTYLHADFVRPYAYCDQPPSLDGHVRWFAYFGGVARLMVYDKP